MTIKLITTTKNFLGTSADAKPTTDVPVGSKFQELDTSAIYIFNGTAWSFYMDIVYEEAIL